MIKDSCVTSSRRALYLFCCAIVLVAANLVATTNADAGIQTWTGAGDGKSFNMASNWAPAAIPNAASECFVPAGPSTVIIGSNVRLKSLSIARNVTLDSCVTVTLTGGIEIAAGAVLTIENTGGCTAFVFDGNTQSISGSGSIAVSSSGNHGILLHARANSVVSIDSGITFTYGPVSYGSGGMFYADSGCSITNRGSVFLRGSATTFTIDGAGQFVNEGEIECAAGTFQLKTATWSNAGVIHLRGGTAVFSGAFSSLGNTTYQSGAIILKGTLSNADITASADTGNITLDGITANSSSLSARDGKSFLLLNVCRLNSCSLETELRILDCASLRVAGGLELIGGASIVVARNCSTGWGLVFELGAQSIAGVGSLSGEFYVAEDTALTINPGVTLRAATGVALTSVTIDPNAVLLNRGTISAQDPNSVLQITGFGTFRNEGTIESSSSAEIKLICSQWENAGAITIDHAKLTVAGAWTNSTSIIGTAAQFGGSASACANNGIISLSQASLAGIFGVPFINNAEILVEDSTLNFGGGTGSWQNTGTISSSDSTLNLAGIYSSLGSIIRSGGSLYVGGTYSGAVLTATPATGDLDLKQLSMTNAALAASGGARIVAHTNVTLTGCTLVSDLYIACASQPIIKNGITLAGVTVHATAGCDSGMLWFQGGTQTIAGTGVLEFNSSGALYVSNTGSLTIASGIELRASGSSAVASLSAATNSTLLNLGRIVASNPSGRFEVSGPVQNVGTVEVLAGEARFLNLLSRLTPLTMSPNTTVDVRAGTYTLFAPVVVPAGAHLSLDGSYTIYSPITVESGGKLTLKGTWTNNSTITATNATVSLAGTWSNPGVIAIDHSALTIGGTYTSLGDFESTANTLTYSGTFRGPVLSADASTGDITLQAVQFVGTTLRTTDGARFKFALNTTVTLNACTLECDLVFDNCAALQVLNGLTMVGGAKIIRASDNCGPNPLTFTGAAQTITGIGEVVANAANSQPAMVISQNSVTLDSGITLRFPSAANPQNQSISSGSGRTFTNKGLISMEVPGRTLSVTGGTFTNVGTVRSTAGTVSLTGMLGNYSVNGFSGGTWIADGGSLTFGSRPIPSIALGTEFYIRGATNTIPDFRALQTNAGKLTVIGRTISITHPGAPGFSNSGELVLGKGTLIAVSGPLNLLAGGSLHVDLTGTAPADFGRITAAESATLGGNLSATFLGPYSPSPGDIFSPIVQASSFTGQFASVCADANPQNLGVLAQVDPAGPPYSLFLLASADAGTAPVITAQPADTLADPDAQFSVSAAPQSVSFTWRKDGEPLTDGVTPWGSVISGSSTNHLSIQSATEFDTGLYDVLVSNSCASIASAAAHLSVCPADLNFDGLVDDADFVLFLASYNLLDCADPAMPALCPGDFNSDGVVDDSDFTLFIPAYDTLLCPEQRARPRHIGSP